MTWAPIASIVLVTGCKAKAGVNEPVPLVAPLSLAKDAQMLGVAESNYIAGSTPEERNAAYDDYKNTAGHDAARTHQWFEGEDERHLAHLGAYRIDLMPVTQAEYAEYVDARRAPPPSIDEEAWNAQGFVQDYAVVQRFNWQEWTSTPFRAGEMTVKGSSWEDHAGLGRGSSRHGRPATSRHVIVGFRCAAPAA
jgi:formylglycine-generating enzyme required for sulfatase activity